MIVEVTRLVDRWLRHPEFGFEPFLPTIPRKTPEGLEEPMPTVPTLYNDTEHEEVALEIDPPRSPALVLFVDEGYEVDAKDPFRHKAQPVIVTVAYLTREVPSLVAVREGAYVLKAVKKSLVRYNDQRIAHSFRELNGVKVAAVGALEHLRVAGAVGRSQLWGFVLASLNVIDTNP
jgi:hypothetical protein